jgi:hypothetical protein
MVDVATVVSLITTEMQQDSREQAILDAGWRRDKTSPFGNMMRYLLYL